jgi:hypothetical protein
MYFDEDGDLAHEFYEEVVLPKSRGGACSRVMKRVSHRRLTPQGFVAYDHPRLSHDCPVVLFQT